MLGHKTWLRNIIEKRISQGNEKDYMAVLKSVYGADPREVWEIYKEYKQENQKKIGLTNLYPDLPEPHPAYSQWRITPESAGLILSKIINKDYKKVCFLGCPVLGTEFAKLVPQKSILLDIDEKVLDYARKFTETKIYDINDEPPNELKNQFECVVCDPPWYYEDIKLFIKRAAELTRIVGTIYISFPGLLTKPSIQDERLEIQKWLSESGLIIAEFNEIAEYEVPPFEYMAYQDIPPFTGEVWRKGDWVKLKKVEDCEVEADMIKHGNWLEYQIDKKRIFLKERVDNKTYEKPELSYLDSNESLILNSVSKRNPLIPKIDIWTSRNAVLHIDKGFSVIKTILENINKEDNEILGIVSERYQGNIEQVERDCIEAVHLIRRLISI